ncbi:hypothetical protein SYNTR_2130 [Candidatus Syntrophocurvum alkaliphilum]|uniref:ATP synthase protein I n=1 Tax=Candidatus Syntrophocurvum alkaliphilum TaxID=2293317 RepID=A0A6I6DIP3_9FIRM|nr:AtpZ/AtpI family protein [Candidatus Syntrophocurvum alkaliphilum]QGU00724.1 hypothetical protein SYNTR_2130 [Candidatus Syntrophocurvum alkaliphilum]
MTQKKQHWAKSLGEAVNLATSVAAAVGIGYLGGRWLDGRFDTEPWLALLGFVIGVATGLKMMYQKAVSGSTNPALSKDKVDKE